MTYNINYATPSANPVAILRNGAFLWSQEEADNIARKSPFAVVMWPRAIAEKAEKASMEAMRLRAEAEPVATEKTVVRVYTERGRARGISFRARVVVYSDDTFDARVEDKQGNTLFPCSGHMASITSILHEAMSEWVDNAE